MAGGGGRRFLKEYTLGHRTGGKFRRGKEGGGEVMGGVGCSYNLKILEA